MDDINKQTYESTEIVESHSAKSGLQKPEKTIIELLRNELASYRMLDIGVGGGRTTAYFAPLAKEYLGVDYSQPMIESCKKKFPFDFRVCDARDMHAFPDANFDFTLFSFNGIDYMNQEDRIASLKEIRRVTRRGGKFCFSSHNLNRAPQLFKLHVSPHPRQLLRTIRLRRANGLLFKSKSFEKFAVLNDGALRFRLLTYYVDPTEQISQLTRIGFEKVRAFGRDGNEVPTHRLASAQDGWIYYLCEAT
jgi:SAM-dependent methyltransferase